MIKWIKDNERYKLIIVERNLLLATLVPNFNNSIEMVWFQGGHIKVFLNQPSSIEEAQSLIVEEIKDEFEKDLTKIKDILSSLNKI